MSVSFFVLKPHVTGSEGQITTPDVIVDHLFINTEPAPVSLVTHEIWRQAPAGETAEAAYGIMALGGGALMLPALVLASGPVVTARSAWRLNNLDKHIGSVELNGKKLSEIGLPADMIESAGGSGDALPRGYLLARTASGIARAAVLTDPVLGRTLKHRVVIETADQDRWGGSRPSPRYSVGPTQREIPHFI